MVCNHLMARCSCQTMLFPSASQAASWFLDVLSLKSVSSENLQLKNTYLSDSLSQSTKNVLALALQSVLCLRHKSITSISSSYSYAVVSSPNIVETSIKTCFKRSIFSSDTGNCFLQKIYLIFVFYSVESQCASLFHTIFGMSLVFALILKYFSCYYWSLRLQEGSIMNPFLSLSLWSI